MLCARYPILFILIDIFDQCFFFLVDSERIDISDNFLIGTIPRSGFIRFSNVKYFNFRNNSLTGTISTALGQLSSVEELHLGLNNFTGFLPSQLGQLKRLRILDLGHNDIRGTIPSAMFQSVMLETLLLNDNALTGTIPSEIRALKGVAESKLSHDILFI